LREVRSEIEAEIGAGAARTDQICGGGLIDGRREVRAAAGAAGRAPRPHDARDRERTSLHTTPPSAIIPPELIVRHSATEAPNAHRDDFARE
jgi:hypothetical protein